MAHRDPIAALRGGDLVVLIDHEAPEVGAELWLSAEGSSASQFARLVRYTTGFVTVVIPAERATALLLPPMTVGANVFHETWPVQSVTCDAAEGVSTGISAADRALTARLLADPATGPDALTRPGHMVPLRVRAGVTDPSSSAQAALELCAEAGMHPAMVRCELLQRSGALARAVDGLAFATEHGLAAVALQDLVSVPAARIA